MIESIKFEFSGPLFERGPEAVQEAADAFVTEVCALLETSVKSLTPVGVFGAQGGLLSTIHGEAYELGTPAVYGVVGHGSPYGDVIELGRRPGKMPPEGVLVPWIMMKTGAVEADAKQIEFLIRRKIGREGFPGAHMFEFGLERSADEITAIAEKTGIKLASDLGGN